MNFKAALKQIVATDGIPDFHLELVEETEAAPADGAAPRRGRNCWGRANHPRAMAADPQ